MIAQDTGLSFIVPLLILQLKARKNHNANAKDFALAVTSKALRFISHMVACCAAVGKHH